MSSTRRRACAALVVCGLAALPWLTLGVLAHEIGTTRVSVVALDRSRFDIEIVTDATALLEKMETVAGEDPSGVTDPVALQHRLETLAPIFQQRVIVSFDGARVQPAVQWTVATPDATGAGPIATLRLTGDVPESAEALTWKYSWTFTSYALSDRRNSAGGAIEWLEGESSSTPISLDAPTSVESRPALMGRYILLGFTHILPKGLR